MPGQRLKNTEALWEAVERSDEASVKALLKQGANPNSKTQEGQTVLMIAAEKGHLGIVSALIKAKAKVNARANNGDTALMLAAYREHLEESAYLLKPKPRSMQPIIKDSQP